MFHRFIGAKISVLLIFAILARPGLCDALTDCLELGTLRCTVTHQEQASILLAITQAALAGIAASAEAAVEACGTDQQCIDAVLTSAEYQIMLVEAAYDIALELILAAHLLCVYNVYLDCYERFGPPQST